MRLLPLVLLFVLAGCKSADELYNEGQRLEMAGQYEAAVRYYADALDKQPDLQKARGRLLEAGRIVVERYLADLGAAEAEGAWVQAGDLHLDLDGLVQTAAGAGVTLPLAPDYATRRAANFDAAITTLLNDGETLVARGAFADALGGYDRARRYRPTNDDLLALDDATLDAYTTWAGAELAAGRFRAAYDRAGQGIALLPPGSLAAAELAGVQNEALRRGTIRTAATPLASATRRLPDGFLERLDDALILDFWTQPPPFVAVLEPALVRRALRDRNLDGEVLTPRQANRLGRTLDVDVTFVGALDTFQRSVETKKREDVTHRTRSGDRVTYTRVEDEVTLWGTVRFAVVAVGQGGALCEREVEQSVQARITRGEYDGSVRTLGLDRDERVLFDPDRLAEQERDLEDRLVDDLAQRVADLAFDCLLSQVP